MAKSKTQWLEKRHELLWNELGEQEVSGEKIKSVLKDKGNVSEDSIAVILSELKKNGFIETKLDPKDSRKRIYSVKNPKTLIRETFDLKYETLTRSDINNILKKAADLIRTRVDYKFILILLFLKRISDKWEEEYKWAVKEAEEEYGLSENLAIEEAKKESYHEFNLPEEYLWESLRKEVHELPEKFSNALKKIGELNPELKDIVDNADFIQFTQNPENAEILRQLVELFSEKRLHKVSADVLGDAYEWILSYFAPSQAKEGEVYSPREVIQLIVEILKPAPEKSIYDPASASNGMLIISYNYVKEMHGEDKADRLFLYGQEANHKTLALGRMNMYIHGIRNFKLENGDTLTRPKFKKKDGIDTFDLVIANPPWNQDGYDEQHLKKAEFWKSRFSYGFTPRQSADWAWIQHMVASAKEDGKVGVIIDNGCLFRGGKEKTIRQSFIEDDLIETVILLPEKLFYNTGAPGAVIILNKSKPKERKDKIMFINASSEYEKHPEVRKLNILAQQNIANIRDVHDNFTEKEGFSRVVDKSEIEENEYNLNVSLYCFPEEEEEDIDINKEWKEAKELEKERGELNNKIEKFLKEVG
ncbi:MAG: N-6 DNA methylase [Candidatus Nanoarchaeia archaeon]